ncbi:MAG: hypothetical protein QM597_00230 [Aeromicrobium sp.]
MFWFIVMIFLSLLVVGTGLAVRADGYGDRPGPRSHQHEFTQRWRA